MPPSPEYPEEGELVVSTVQSVKNFGAFVALDEYGSREGFIHVSEIATGWVKYIRDYVKEGQKIVCKVVEVDRSKGHVNLSLKQVNDHQRREKIQLWKNENKAKKLLDILAEKIGEDPKKFYDEVGTRLIEEFSSLYTALEVTAADPSILKKKGFAGQWVAQFEQIAAENIAPASVKIDGMLELSSPKSDGIDDIRSALSVGVRHGEDFDVSVQYVGAPKYRLLVTAGDYKRAEDEIKKSADHIVKTVTKLGGAGKFTRSQ